MNFVCLGIDSSRLWRPAPVVVGLGLLACLGVLDPSAAQVGSADQTPGSGTDLVAVPAATCAEHYHGRLQSVRAGELERLRAAYAAIKAEDEELEGNWMFSTGQRRPLRSARAVATAAGERSEPAGGDDSVARLARLQAKRASAQRFLGASVRELGALPELFGRGTHGWMTYKYTTDLGAYLSQGGHPALCSGVTQMLDFYGRRLQPLEKRRDGAAEVLADAFEVARSAWHEVVAALVEHGKRSRGVAEQSTPTAGAVTSTGDPKVPDTIAPVATADRFPLPEDAQLAGALARLVIEVLAGEVPNPAPAAQISLAELPMIVKSWEALRRTASEPVIAIARPALAAVELLVYAESYQRRVTGYVTALRSTLDAIVEAHTATCTCDKR